MTLSLHVPLLTYWNPAAPNTITKPIIEPQKVMHIKQKFASVLHIIISPILLRMTLLIQPMVMSTTSSFDLMMEKAKEGQQQRQPFPLQLHKLLDLAQESGDEDVLSWLPCGTAFRVHDREKFAKKFMKTFFKQSVFKSFLRQLNMWGFRRVVHGKGKGAYQHDLFRRGEPELCYGMVRGGPPDSQNTTSEANKRLRFNTISPRGFQQDTASIVPTTLSQLDWSDATNPLTPASPRELGRSVA